ncbi:MAG: glutamate-5-semialdehyde dehydrogenase [Pseudomonadota bacterium]
MNETDAQAIIGTLGRQARDAVAILSRCDGSARAAGIRAMANALREGAPQVLEANAADVAAAEANRLSAAMVDRLRLDSDRVAAIADALDAIAALPDPVGRELSRWQPDNGLDIARVSVPLGVIGIVYESRPNVTADAAAICLKAGNAVILRGGSESAASSRAIVALLRSALEDSGLPADAVQMVPDQDRILVGALLAGGNGTIDVVVPRGGRGLIERVQRDARVPVIGHLDGICHIYLHSAADAAMARDITVNAKLRRTGICGAAETLLVDAALAPETVRSVFDALFAADCAVRGCERSRAMDDRITPATEADWRTEYLDRIIAVRVVDDLDAAVEHISEFGSGHTESIITSDAAAAQRFFDDVDSAIVMHNASTQFADGGEFGMGAEIGISTSRIHARGPVGAAELVSYKYVVRGSGQTRP